MNLTITPAGDAHYALFQNLLQFYVYDMAEHANFPFEADGSFAMGDSFDPYFGRPRPSRPWPAEWKASAFMAHVDGKPAGFALVNVQSETPSLIDMSEFFVARQYRRHRIGEQLAAAMFDRFPGNWEVREMLTNIAAQKFWNRVINTYTNGNFTEGRERFERYRNSEFVVQRFTSGQ
ncbi:MAG TPA: GNAT family N-acetyltransferase [Rhizomicrobium sp.]|jgi:predicted acetyltransferase|nr:GNAT family N-acetyltransferase [Rhizomicrobium sp.]